MDDDINKWFEFLQRLEIRLTDIARNPTPKQLENQEFMLELSRDLERISEAVKTIEMNIKNWIVADIEVKGSEVVKIIFKPLDASPYCSNLFDKCKGTLIMSATILNKEAFCNSVGPVANDVKYIQVESDFPVENRPIFQTNTAYLNYNNLGLQETHSKIALDVDNIMTLHNEHKGIIHTTSYQQLNFIRENMFKQNKARLIVTDPSLKRIDVIQSHISAEEPTVLISPSLFLGIDLKMIYRDSRLLLLLFEIITERQLYLFVICVKNVVFSLFELVLRLGWVRICISFGLDIANAVYPLAYYQLSLQTSQVDLRLFPGFHTICFTRRLNTPSS